VATSPKPGAARGHITAAATLVSSVAPPGELVGDKGIAALVTLVSAVVVV
jgi:hypothetical protein